MTTREAMTLELAANLIRRPDGTNGQARRRSDGAWEWWGQDPHAATVPACDRCCAEIEADGDGTIPPHEAHITITPGPCQRAGWRWCGTRTLPKAWTLMDRQDWPMLDAAAERLQRGEAIGPYVRAVRPARQCPPGLSDEDHARLHGWRPQ